MEYAAPTKTNEERDSSCTGYKFAIGKKKTWHFKKIMMQYNLEIRGQKTNESHEYFRYALKSIFHQSLNSACLSTVGWRNFSTPWWMNTSGMKLHISQVLFLELF